MTVCAAFAIALLVALTPSVAAASGQPLRTTSTCVMDVNGVWQCEETGAITGHAVIADTSLVPTGPYTLHYVEHGVVTASDGTVVIDVQGIANGLNGGWRAEGVVSDATGAYADLIGRHVQEMGTTSGAAGPGMTSVGAVTILPG